MLGRTSVVKRSLARRSGEMSRTSIASAARPSWTAFHSSTLPELMVAARSPRRPAIAIWLRISASSGLMISVGPWPLVAADARRDPVDEALAPAGSLDDERAATVLGDDLDRLALAVAEGRVRARAWSGGAGSRGPWAAAVSPSVRRSRFRSAPMDPPRASVAKVPEVAVRAVVGLQRAVLVAAVVRQGQGLASRGEHALRRAAPAHGAPWAFDERTVGDDHGGVLVGPRTPVGRGSREHHRVGLRHLGCHSRLGLRRRPRGAQCGLEQVADATQVVPLAAQAASEVAVSKIGQAKVAAGRGLRAYDGALKRRWPRGRWAVHGVTALVLVSFAASAGATPDASTASTTDASPTATPVTVAQVTVAPTVAPTPVPTAEPTSEPTAEPTAEPTPEPTKAPTFAALKKAAEKPKWKTLFRNSEDYLFESVYYNGKVS